MVFLSTLQGKWLIEFPDNCLVIQNLQSSLSHAVISFRAHSRASMSPLAPSHTQGDPSPLGSSCRSTCRYPGTCGSPSGITSSTSQFSSPEGVSITTGTPGFCG